MTLQTPADAKSEDQSAVPAAEPQKKIPYPTEGHVEQKNGNTDKNNAEESEPVPADCPFCGGKLVLRTARKGARTGKQFYGCSNYPKCGYIRNV